MLRHQRHRVVAAGVVGIVLHEIAGGEASELPVTRLAGAQRDCFQLKRGGTPCVGSGHGEDGFFNLDQKRFRLLRLIFAQQNVGAKNGGIRKRRGCARWERFGLALGSAKFVFCVV